MGNPEIIIVDTKPEHLREMAGKMHANISSTVLRLGVSPKKALWKSFKTSLICRTAFINGEIAAIWGLGGEMMGDVGLPWLILAPAADDYPMRVAFAYRRELEKMQRMFPLLIDLVDETNEKAVRMLELMNFKISKERFTVNDVNLRKAERRAEWA